MHTHHNKGRRRETHHSGGGAGVSFFFVVLELFETGIVLNNNNKLNGDRPTTDLQELIPQIYRFQPSNVHKGAKRRVVGQPETEVDVNIC